MQIDREKLDAFRLFLQEQECSGATVTKYMHDVKLLSAFCGGEIEDKGALIAFKQRLQERGYAPASVNSMLAAVNRFLAFAGHPEWKLRYLKAPRSTFCGRERAEIRCEGRMRVILLPGKLCEALLHYCLKRAIQSGCVFVTRTGRPLDRSNIWKSMKRLAARASVVPGKVFPHDLRRLFARTYYKAYKDIVRLADILGHASIDTPRIYTTRTGTEQQRQIERLPLLV